jgi:ribose transport system substrate-binding protein
MTETGRSGAHPARSAAGHSPERTHAEMPRKPTSAMAAVAVGAILSLLAACGSSGSAGSTGTPSGSASSVSKTALAKDVRAELAGHVPASVKAELNSGPPLGMGQPVPGYPHGVRPSPASIFHFTPAEIAKLKRGHYTAGIAMHLMNAAWPTLQVQAITKTLQGFGIKVVAVTNPNFNPSTQVNQLQTLIARRPTAIFSIPVNPTTEATTYKQVTKAGIKLVLMDNVPPGMAPGKDYLTVISANNGGDARFATEQMAKQLGCHGTVGYLGLGIYFPVVTTRDNTALKILSRCSNVTVVKQTFTDETSQAFSEASSMLQAHSDITGMWAAWDTVAMQVVAAEKPLGKKMFIATSDLGPDSALAMAQGYISASGGQQPYAQGVAEADALAYNLLGKKVPPFIELPTVPITQQDLIPAYKIVMHASPPASVIAALKASAGL